MPIFRVYEVQEEITIGKAQFMIDEEYRIETYANVGKRSYSDGRYHARATDALAMARAEGLDV